VRAPTASEEDVWMGHLGGRSHIIQLYGIYLLCCWCIRAILHHPLTLHLIILSHINLIEYTHYMSSLGHGVDVPHYENFSAAKGEKPVLTRLL